MTSPTGPLVWPTTPLQRGLLALAETRPDDPYTGQAVVRIRGSLPAGALRRAVEGLVADEPQLHAGFVVADELEAVQFVEPGTTPRFRTVVLDDPANLAADLARTRAADLAAGFALDAPPLVRWTHLEAGEESALVVTAHHTVLDAWSMPLLAGEVARRLTAEVPGPHDVPAAPGARYDDHLGWLAAQDSSAAEEFWVRHLGHLTGTPGTPAPSPRGARRRLRATVRPSRGEAWDGLTAADRARTCWGLALDAVTGSTGTPFAVPVSGRDPQVAGVQTAIGLFTDSVLVADPTTPASTLLDVTRAGADRWRASLPHHHVGTSGILRALRSPELATSLLAVETPEPPRAWRVGPATLQLEDVEDDTHYPFALTVRPGADGWELLLDHTGPGTTARRLLHAVAAFLVAEPHVTVAAVPVLDAADDDALQRNGIGPAVESAVPPLLPQRWAEVAARCADRDLLVTAGPGGETSRQTGADLARAVDALRADVLAALPAGPGRRRTVAVSVPRGNRTVEAVLAVLTAGAAVLVLDPALPAVRRADVLAGAGALALVTADAVVPLHDGPRGAVAVVPGPDDVAAVVLTSGSTGTPKPVAVPHRALAHLCARQLTGLHPAHPVQVAHTAAFHFDAQWDALLALFGGHTVHVLAEDLFLDPFALAQHVRDHAIAYLDLTPTVWSALLAADAFTELPAVCVVGGEAFGPDLWTRMRDLAARTGSRVLNLYGPTEATVDAFAADVRDADVPVVGTPVGVTGAVVLDAWLRLVPPGTDGELYLAGEQLAHGYRGLPARTAERFVANPFPHVPGDRLYRTGDRARWDEDGRLHVAGRTDDQISLHGLRIEPGEVEHALAAHPGVSRAVVLAPQVGRGRRLVAWVVPAGAHPDPAALRAWCAERLPAHLVPRDVLVVDDLPLTRNGKLDRAALPLPGAVPAGPTSASGGEGVVARVVAEAFTEVLGVPAVGAHDDFFALGGDSISAVRVAARLRAAGWSLRPADVLVARTPAAVAAHAVPETADPVATGPSTSPEVPDLVPLDPAVRAELATHVRDAVTGSPALQAVWPLTPTQLGVHVDGRRAARDPYRTTVLLRLHDPAGRVDETAVRRAVAGLFARHPALRTGVWQGPLHEPVAFVVERVEFPLDVVRVPGPVGDDLLDRVQRTELDRPVDPAAARLAGATWIAGENSPTSFLVLSLHHLLADGWSLPVLADELRRDLDGEDLAAETGGFPDHLRTVAALDRDALAQSWRSELAGAEPTLLGGGRSADTDRVVRRQRTLTAERTAALRSGARDRGASVAAVAQAAWAHVLAARTGRRDVCWALTSAGRGADVPATAVGMFVTTRVLRAGTASATLVRDVADATARTEEAAVLGLGGVERATGRLADTLVVVENYPVAPTQGDGLAVTLVEGRDATTFPVTATLFPGPGDLRFELEVDPELLGGDAGAELLDAWVSAVEALAAGRVPDLALTQVVPTGDAPGPEHPVSRDDGADPDLARRVAEVVAQVLGAAAGLDDDFFAAGGDSISAVHLVGALRAASIVVGIADVFAARTPRALAALARAVETSAGPRDGVPVPTPALAWFAGLGRAADVAALRGFQQLRVVDLPAGTGVADLAAAATELLARHEALRLRTEPDLRVTAPRPAVVAAAPVAELDTALAAAAATIDHTTGDLVRWVVTDPGGPTPRLAVAAHHVAVDPVSWAVLLDELRVLLEGGTLPPAPSFTAWTHAQQRAVDVARDHRAHWQRELRPCRPLVEVPADLGTAGDATTREVVLDPLRSRRFLDLVARGWRPDAVLLAALTSARADDLLVELEGHGRPTALPADDPRETADASAVGWFTATWPVRLPGRDPSRSLADHVAATARAVLSSAALGPDAGVLQHLDPASADLATAVAANPAQVLVNWLGREVPAGPEHHPWRTSADAAALEDRLGLHAGLPVSHAWELNAWATTRDFEPAVVARWQVAAPLRHRAGDVLDRWLADLETLLDVVLDTGTNPPSAVHDAVGLGTGELSRLAADVPALQAVWPLTPVQRGMVFHAGDGPDRYTSHVELRLGGGLDADRLRTALAETVAAHPQLRCRVADTTSGPVLVSVAAVDVPWSVHDVPGGADAGLDAHRRADLAEPYDLRTGPLLRARLVSTAPDEHVLLLGSHHLLLDGWSVPALVDELLGRYAGTWRAAAEDVVRGAFATAVARRAANPGSLPRWRNLLTPVAADLVPLLPPGFDDGEPVAVATADLPPRALTSAARACGATPAAVLAAAWSIVLSALSGRKTVSPGVVVSGRDAGSQDVLGMFVDTVPLVARCRGRVEDLVRDLAGQTLHAGAQAPVGLAALAGALGRAPWTDTLLVVENYPGGGTERAATAAGLDLRDVTGRDGTHYALTLTLEDTREDTGDTGALRLEHHPRLLSAAEAVDVLSAVADVVVRAADPAAEVADVLPRSRFAAVAARWDALRDASTGTGPVEQVQAVFAELFGRTVDEDEDFFALGGDSVLAMSLVSGLRTRGWSVRPSAVFTAPSPAALAALAAPLAPPPTTVPPAAPLVDLDAGATAALDRLLRNLG
ncbi:condensation domain-containing protein [Kineococcus endophyticus]|uniref:Condensation domain-containing protein n=1 Tax=Kineococcus endophyticus TaxID=1181883 RepID=A0ABV3PC68_9ACTN